MKSPLPFLLVMFVLVFGAGFVIGYFSERTGMVYTQSEIDRLRNQVDNMQLQEMFMAGEKVDCNLMYSAMGKVSWNLYDMVDRLKVGQTKPQVRQLLGTPLLVSPFRESRWDYVYEFTRQGRVVEHRTFTAYFVDEKLARWEGDEMPASIAELNKSAAAITAGESAWSDPRSWWEQLLDVFKK